jgi:hypothetical protein
MEVIQKGLAEIGNLWYENRSSVQQEHFASSLAVRRLDALLSASPPPTRNQTLIVGCPPNEWHTLTPLLLSLLLRRRGLNVLYLGANVPDSQFTDTVRQASADLVVLVAQHLLGAATLRRTAFVLSAQKIPVAFGGRIFTLRPDISAFLPGYYLGPDIHAALDEIETILKGRVERREPRVISHAYETAHQAFASKRPQIELTVRESLEPLSISPEDIDTGIHFLGENITAALQLGDMSHVSAEIDWLQGLLRSHGSYESQLEHFMRSYVEAIDKSIDGQGQPIFEWIEAEIQRFKS